MTAPVETAFPREPPGPVPFAGHKPDLELFTIARILGFIEALNPEARARVAAYVAARFL